MSMMEAMCAGCAVITTGSGGAIEIADAAGLPLFPKDDPVSLGRLIARLAADPQWVFDVAMRGQAAVLKHFTFVRMADALLRTLQGVSGKSDAWREPRGTGSTQEGLPRPTVR